MSGYNNLKDWFVAEDEAYKMANAKSNVMCRPPSQFRSGHPVRISNKEVCLQFWGMELVLKPDGTYILNDTSGG